MNKTVKQICNEILKGNTTDENMPLLLNFMANEYHTYAGVGLSMHYYAFYESYVDEEGTWSQEAKDMVNKLNQMIVNHIVEHQVEGLEESITAIDGMRKDIMNRMNILTTYTDIFQLYEYVLNRVEYRFKAGLANINDEEIARDILAYIFESDDNYVVNEKIKEIVGQLPIKMTKQKFFAYLEESLRLYLGSEKSTLDSYVYMLKTSAALDEGEGLSDLYPLLWEKREKFASYDYKGMTEPEYKEAMEMLRLTTLILENETTIYYNLQELMNEVYARLLTTSYAGLGENEMEEEENAVIAIITSVANHFISGNKEDLPMELLDQFAPLEGIQEALMEDLVYLEEALFELDRNGRDLAESIMCDKILNVLLLSKDLLSNSIFIDFDEVRDTTTVDEDMMHNVIESIEQSYKDKFTTSDKKMVRAIMANSLSKMPVFFQSHTEVMDYVVYSLEHCGDHHEKIAAVEIIRGIMAE